MDGAADGTMHRSSSPSQQPQVNSSSTSSVGSTQRVSKVGLASPLLLMLIDILSVQIATRGMSPLLDIDPAIDPDMGPIIPIVCVRLCFVLIMFPARRRFLRIPILVLFSSRRSSDPYLTQDAADFLKVRRSNSFSLSSTLSSSSMTSSSISFSSTSFFSGTQNISSSTQISSSGVGNGVGSGVGSDVGCEEGIVEGNGEGRVEGNDEGVVEGNSVGNGVSGVGNEEGNVEGNEEGRVEGNEEGRAEGNDEGRAEGNDEGRVEGNEEGSGVGPNVPQKSGKP
eukprot:scaffold567_cov170-Amphora_coffeaeformis.AAC.16